jgi:hypothetical protein
MNLPEPKHTGIPGARSETTWGEPIEDRGSQITYSALGQQAPIHAKEQWDPDFGKRKLMKVRLDKLLPGFLCIQVRDPEESKRVIEAIAACLGEVPRPAAQHR